MIIVPKRSIPERGTIAERNIRFVKQHLML